jgi:hypothetical protein
MNIAPYIAGAVGCISLIGAGYAVLVRGGYVIDEATAGELVQTASAREAIKRERGDLLLKRDLAFNRLSFLNSIKRTTDQDLESDLLRQDIQRINDRLAELDQ